MKSIKFFLLPISLFLFLSCGNSSDGNEAVTKDVSETPEEISNKVEEEKKPKEKYRINTEVKTFKQYIQNLNGGLFRNHPDDGDAVWASLPYGIQVDVSKELIDNQSNEVTHKWVKFHTIQGWMAAKDISELPVDQAESYDAVHGGTPDSAYIIGTWLRDLISRGQHFPVYMVFKKDGTYCQYEMSSKHPTEIGTWQYHDNKLTLDDGYYMMQNNKNKPLLYPTIRAFEWFDYTFYKVNEQYGPGQLQFAQQNDVNIYEKPDLKSDILKTLSKGADVITFVSVGDDVSIDSLLGKFVQINYKGEKGYVFAPLLNETPPRDFIYLDPELLIGEWRDESGEGLLLEANGKWSWDGPESEDEYGKWEFDKQNGSLSLSYDTDPKQKRVYQISSLTHHWFRGNITEVDYDFRFLRNSEINTAN